MNKNVVPILKAAVSAALIVVAGRTGIAQEIDGSNRPAAGFVTYTATDETPVKAITAIALQSGIPVGIAFGRDQQLLCHSHKSFDIRNRTPGDALAEVSASASYTLHEEQHVLVLTAPDLAPWQRAILDYRYSTFPAYSRVAMVTLGARLTAAIRMTLGGATTFAASTLYSPSDHMLTLSPMANASTEEIANHIVGLDGKGLWVIRSAISPPTSAAEAEALIYSYLDDAKSIRELACGP